MTNYWNFKGNFKFQYFPKQIAKMRRQQSMNEQHNLMQYFYITFPKHCPTSARNKNFILASHVVYCVPALS